jgi:hypothetical protein
LDKELFHGCLEDIKEGRKEGYQGRISRKDIKEGKKRRKERGEGIDLS